MFSLIIPKFDLCQEAISVFFASCDNWTGGDAVKGIQILNPVSPGSFVFNSAFFGLIAYPSH